VSISRPAESRPIPLARLRRVVGEDDVITLGSASYLGLVLWSLGEHQQARQLQADALTRSRRTLSEDHPETLRAASFLGLTLRSVGEHQQARRLHTDAPTRSRRVLGDDHPYTLRIASLLALALGWLGEHRIHSAQRWSERVGASPSPASRSPTVDAPCSSPLRLIKAGARFVATNPDPTGPRL
jgi:Tetratricopeptide repeat